MVKHQKDRLYQTSREERLSQQLRGGRNSLNSSNNASRSLPFNCCALTLNPFTNPVCSRSGIIFENSAIIPHLIKYKKDPVTGLPMSSKDLITLHMNKDEEGRWQCPVLLKPFSEHVKIAAILQNPPGNEAYVYSFEAVQELNLKPKNYEDLTTGKPFQKNDIIILQDPAPDSELHKLRDINNFKHIATLREENIAKIQSAEGSDIRHSLTSQRIMDKIQTKRQADAPDTIGSNKISKLFESSEKTSSSSTSDKEIIFIDELIGVQYSCGKTSGSFTSTSVSISNENKIREATVEEIRSSLFQTMKQLKQKCTVRLQTNFGTMDLELFCDIAPRTCTNFIGLVEQKKYNGSCVHRLIPKFMVQMGKSSHKGDKETSLWGDAFVDEFDDRLKHDGPGVVSMANAGPGTNLRQFFITFRSTPHLDRKHSVFGKVSSGMDVLWEMERIPTDNKNRPSENIQIIQADIIGPNPVQQAQRIESDRIQRRKMEKLGNSRNVY